MDETERHREEIFSKEASISDNIERIRQQVEVYRERNEKKRLEFVEEKMRQKWRFVALVVIHAHLNHSRPCPLQKWL